MKRVILLGSTGSIGRNAITVIKRLNDFRLVGLAAYNNYQLLMKQAEDLNPESVNIVNQKYYKNLKKRLGHTRLTCGEDGVYELIEATRADVIICAFASSIGIHGIIKAIEKKMRICLATKEILVSFGDIVMQKVEENNVELIPIDSEHSAVYQCLERRRKRDVLNIILTASGGPFLHRSMVRVKKQDVLRHPVWAMGAKITVDSATMMNKGLEVIEAHHLFGFPAEQIKVIIHPEAICHSLIQLVDGSLIAQLSTPDMKLPIQYALTAPARLKSPAKYLELDRIRKLTFQAPDLKKFPCLRLAYEALNTGRSMPAVLNAANAEAVRLFLDDKLKFNQIPKTIEKVMTKHRPKTGKIEDYVEAEKWARDYTRSLSC